MIAFYNYGNKNKTVFPKELNPILFPFNPWPPEIITDTGEMFWERHSDIKPDQRLDNLMKRRIKELSKMASDIKSIIFK